jgi:4-oxalocrotonate tautomerase
MPLIEVTLGDGRSAEQVRDMMHAVHQAAMQTLNIEAEHIHVIVRVVSRDHWSTGDSTLGEMDTADARKRPAQADLT